MEDNEWSFCSLWTERIKTGCAEALTNGNFEGDYFFNRASVHNCPDPSVAVRQIAKVLWQKGMDCYIHDRDDRLAGEGLAMIDTMHVLRVGSRSSSGKTKIVSIGRQLLPAWIDVFCRTFAVPEWRPEIERIMMTNFAKLELLLSYKADLPVGCAALFNKNGVTGLYCLGTISQQRGRGLASDMLNSAISENLFLQTLGSEELLPLYKKAGFVVAYTKKIYSLARPNKLEFEKPRSVINLY